MPAMDTPAVVVAFERHASFMGKQPVEPDLLADSRFILSDGLGDSGLGGTVGYPCKDYPSFF